MLVGVCGNETKRLSYLSCTSKRELKIKELIKEFFTICLESKKSVSFTGYPLLMRLISRFLSEENFIDAVAQTRFDLSKSLMKLDGISRKLFGQDENRNQDSEFLLSSSIILDE